MKKVSVFELNMGSWHSDSLSERRIYPFQKPYAPEKWAQFAEFHLHLPRDTPLFGISMVEGEGDPLGSQQSNPALVVIPARWASTRFPGKPLHCIAGKPLVQHVWDRVAQCQSIDRAVIATDDERIQSAAEEFGAEVIMTSPDHPSGTDRAAEVAESFPNHPFIINVQGDEPLIDPTLVDSLVQLLASPGAPDMVTAATPIENRANLDDPNIVKVVLNAENSALYFSRSVIPHARVPDQLTHLRHLGIYGYRRDFLLNFVNWGPAPIELAESLEQLRALHHGARIDVITCEDNSIGIDTPEQAAALEAQLTSHPNSQSLQ